LTEGGRHGDSRNGAQAGMQPTSDQRRCYQIAGSLNAKAREVLKRLRNFVNNEVAQRFAMEGPRSSEMR
jgi:hypothetical protein